MDKDRYERYDRQIRFSRLGEEGQEKLSRARVALVGCGGLGSTLAQCMARAGIAGLTIIDRDGAEISNLHRQFLFDMDDVESGENKALAAAGKLKKADPAVEIMAKAVELTPANIDELLSGHHLVLDGLDNMDTRYMVNDWCLANRVPWIYGGVLGSSGMVLTVMPEGPCLRCLFPDPKVCAGAPGIPEVGIINTLPAHIATIQATEAQKILVGSTELIRDLRVIDLWTGECKKIPLKRRAGCKACGAGKST